MSKLLIYVELSAEEKESAIQAFKIAHNDVFDPQFAPDRAWVEGYAYARAAVQAAQPEAVGWKLVPVEPTPAMLVAMWDHRESMRGQSENRIARAGYAAMLASAPTEPMSAPTAEPVAKVSESRPVLYSDEYATPPSAATPEPSDAERYRYLRDFYSPPSDEPWDNMDCALAHGGEELDALIDAAIRATKGGKL